MFSRTCVEAQRMLCCELPKNLICWRRMNTKQIQTTLADVQRRLGFLEKQMIPNLWNSRMHAVDKHLEKSQQEDRDRQARILRKTGRVLSHLQLDPVAWQRKMRKKWGERMKRQMP